LRFLRQPIDIETAIARYAPVMEAFQMRLPRWLSGDARQSLRHQARVLAKAGVAKDLALRIAALEFLDAALDITEVAVSTQGNVEKVAETYFALDAFMDLYWLRSCIRELPRGDLWQRKARTGLLNELQTATREITCQVLNATTHVRGVAQKIAFWAEANRDHLHHCRTVFDEIRLNRIIDLSMLTVAVREIQTAARRK
jgi:glutamate dehydrogenase